MIFTTQNYKEIAITLSMDQLLYLDNLLQSLKEDGFGVEKITEIDLMYQIELIKSTENGKKEYCLCWEPETECFAGSMEKLITKVEQEELRYKEALKKISIENSFPF